MAIKIVYKTTDGKEFQTKELAEAHENKIDALKKEIKEDISKILIKLKDLKNADVNSDDDGYFSISNEEQLEDKFLCSLKTVLDDIMKSEYNVESYLVQYYDSSC